MEEFLMFILRTLVEIIVLAIGVAAGLHLVQATTGVAGSVNNELTALEG